MAAVKSCNQAKCKSTSGQEILICCILHGIYNMQILYVNWDSIFHKEIVVNIGEHCALISDCLPLGTLSNLIKNRLSL